MKFRYSLAARDILAPLKVIPCPGRILSITLILSCTADDQHPTQWLSVSRTLWMGHGVGMLHVASAVFVLGQYDQPVTV